MQQRKQRSGCTMGLLSLGLFVGAALMAGPAQADRSNGPYYAEPAWDQKLRSGTTRFVILSNWGDEAVLDRNTGLVWQRSPLEARQRWSDARSGCLNTTTGGREGWRLPSVAELASLIDPSLSPPFVPSVFDGVQSSSPYWSATTNAEFPSSAWIVSFVQNVKGVSTTHKTDSLHVWCVRGGMNADAY
jgi:hypothetical protein